MPIDITPANIVLLSDTFTQFKDKVNILVGIVNDLPATLLAPISRLGGTIDGLATGAPLSGTADGDLFIIKSAGLGVGDFLGVTDEGDDQPKILYGIGIHVRRDTGYANVVIESVGGTVAAGKGSLVLSSAGISTTGNIAIGTTNPDSVLHLFKANNTTIHLQTEDKKDSQLIFSGGHPAVAGEYTGMSLFYDGGAYDGATGEYGRLEFSDFDEGTRTARVTIERSGNVGIGTTNPTKQLHLMSGHVEGTTLRIENSGANPAVLSLKSGGVDGHSWALYQPGDSDSLRFFSSDVTDGPPATAVIDFLADGSVGIGTSVPQQKLTVEGPNVQLLLKESNSEFVRLGVEETTGEMCLGWDDADDMHFGVFGSAVATSIATRMIIKSTGRVGIGTTDPKHELHVIGNIILGASGDERYIHFDNRGALQSDADLLIVADVNQTTASSTTGDIIFGMGSAASGQAAGTSDFHATYPTDVPLLEVMRIVGGTGNVGIGTTTPGAQLEVANTAADAIIRITNSDSGFDPTLQFVGNNPINSEGFEIWYDNATHDSHLSTTYAGSQASIRFHTRTEASKATGNERLTIHADGNIGICTRGIAPPNRLSIYHDGSDGSDGIMMVRDDSSTSEGELLGGIGFDSIDGLVPSTILEASAFIAAYAAEDHTVNDKGGHLAFGTSLIDDNDDTVSIEHMRIDSTGRVGIGTEDPKQQLHITINNAQLALEESATEFLRLGVGETEGTAILGWGTAAGTPNLILGTYTSTVDATISPMMTITSDGRVGMRTTTPPDQQLHIEGDPYPQILLEALSSPNEFVRLGVGETADTSVLGWKEDDALQIGTYASTTDASITPHLSISSPTGNTEIGPRLDPEGDWTVASKFQTKLVVSNGAISISKQATNEMTADGRHSHFGQIWVRGSGTINNKLDLMFTPPEYPGSITNIGDDFQLNTRLEDFGNAKSMEADPTYSKKGIIKFGLLGLYFDMIDVEGDNTTKILHFDGGSTDNSTDYDVPAYFSSIYTAQISEAGNEISDTDPNPRIHVESATTVSIINRSGQEQTYTIWVIGKLVT